MRLICRKWSHFTPFVNRLLNCLFLRIFDNIILFNIVHITSVGGHVSDELISRILFEKVAYDLTSDNSLIQAAVQMATLATRAGHAEPDIKGLENCLCCFDCVQWSALGFKLSQESIQRYRHLER